MLLLAYDYDKHKNLLTLSAAEVDKNSGQLTGDWQTLTEFQKDSKKDDINYRVALNADSTKMVIVSSVEGKSKNTLFYGMIIRRIKCFFSIEKNTN